MYILIYVYYVHTYYTYVDNMSVYLRDQCVYMRGCVHVCMYVCQCEFVQILFYLFRLSRFIPLRDRFNFYCLLYKI